jgi:hypothetical protein
LGGVNSQNHYTKNYLLNYYKPSWIFGFEWTAGFALLKVQDDETV